MVGEDREILQVFSSQIPCTSGRELPKPSDHNTADLILQDDSPLRRKNGIYFLF